MPTMARYGDPSLPTLVLLHGFLGTKADWLPLMPALSQHFHCICLDLPGHGDNQAEGSTEAKLDFDFCVENIVTRLDSLNPSPDQFHLYGYSLGGRIALHLAKAYPQRLLSLNLESCHPGLVDPQEKWPEPRMIPSGASVYCIWLAKIFKLVVSAARVCRHDCGQT